MNEDRERRIADRRQSDDGDDYNGEERRHDVARRSFWNKISAKIDESVATSHETGKNVSQLWAAAVVLVAAIGFGAMGAQTFVTIRALPATVEANTEAIRNQAAIASASRIVIDSLHTRRMNATDSLLKRVTNTQEYLICRDDPIATERECAAILFR